MSADPYEVARAVTRAHHEEWARVVAVLTGQFGDLDVAEEAAADAFATAVDRWRAEGVPPNPGGWLTTTARRKAIDRLRRESRRDEKHQAAQRMATTAAEETTSAIDDDRLRLIFTCCHPEIPLEARVALTLRMVGGLTVPEIARAFLVRETTMGQRISRAKARIKAARLPYRIPSEHDLPQRLGGVLAVLYLVFNEGYLSSDPSNDPVRQDLVGEGIRLTRLLRRLAPQETEVDGLLALMLFAEARRATRVSAEGELVTLAEQNRGAWDHAMIDAARLLVTDACRARPSPGPYLTLAAISAMHATAPDAADTDWPGIVALYDHLAHIDPSPVVRLNRAVAVAEVRGPRLALELVDQLRGPLATYHPYFVVRADLSRRLGRLADARADYDRAIALTGNSAEAAYLRRRRAEL